MREFIRVGAVCGIVTLAATLAWADEVHGAIWQVERQDGTTWRFKAGPGGRLFNQPPEGLPQMIGTWSGGRAKTTLNFDAPGVKGGKKRTIILVLVSGNPPKWQGEVHMPDGRKAPLKVTLIKD